MSFFISISLSTCSWFSTIAIFAEQWEIGKIISWATASWYKGVGIDPTFWAAIIDQYRWGLLRPIIQIWSPSLIPRLIKPKDKLFTYSYTSFQDQDCQIPNSFSLKAGVSANWIEYLSRMAGNVCTCAVQKWPLWTLKRKFAVLYF